MALHPNYSFSYAPGVVLAVQSDNMIKVRLYDGTETQLPRDEVYFLDKNKFELDVKYIVLCEDQWVGKAVVYRNTATGTYQLGTWTFLVKVICNLSVSLGKMYGCCWKYSTWHPNDFKALRHSLRKPFILNSVTVWRNK